MLRAEKEQIVTELAERLSAASGLILADYRGLSVPDFEELRSKLVDQGAQFAVCKNRLTKLAAEQAGVVGLDPFLNGPTGIAFVIDGDMIAVAKTLSETAEKSDVLAFKGGILDGNALDADSLRALAALPPEDVIRGQFVAALIAPARGLAGVLAASLRDFAGVLDARAKQLDEGSEAAPPPSDTDTVVDGDVTGERDKAAAESVYGADPAGSGEESSDAAAAEADEASVAGGGSGESAETSVEADQDSEESTEAASEPSAEPDEAAADDQTSESDQEEADNGDS